MFKSECLSKKNRGFMLKTGFRGLIALFFLLYFIHPNLEACHPVCPFKVKASQINPEGSSELKKIINVLEWKNPQFDIPSVYHIYSHPNFTQKNLLAIIPADQKLVFEDFTQSIKNTYFLAAFDEAKNLLFSAKISFKGSKAHICCPPFIKTQFLPDGQLDTPYLKTIHLLKKFPDVTFKIIKGCLPPGLTLSSNGVISGNPSKEGFFNFIVQAKSKCCSKSTRFLSIEIKGISCPRPFFLTTTLSDASVGIPYTQTISTLEGSSVSFSLFFGSLPPGLFLSQNGVISGTPTTPGTYIFVIQATRSCGSTSFQLFSLTVVNPCAAPIFITTGILPFTTVGDSYSQTIETTGGVPPISFALASGSLPPGLTLSDTGVISGITTEAGAFDFTISATSSCGTSLQDFSILVDPCILPTIITTELPDGLVSESYDETIEVINFTMINIIEGSLPPGLNLNPFTGEITGTPSQTGTSNFTVEATNDCGSTTQDLSITITGVLPPPG